MIRLLVADDHAVVRQGIIQILSEASDMSVAGEAGNAVELAGLAGNVPWDVLLLDITMPGRSGLDVLRDIKTRWPARPVLILSMYPEEEFAFRALKAGASGYVNKSGLPAILLEAIRKVHTGARYISPALAEKLAVELGEGRESRPLHGELSDREMEVLRLIAAGRKAHEIADELSLSVRTVNTYRARILEKMHMRTNAELIRYALEHSLV